MYRFQQVIITIIHLALLAWIIYILRESGRMKLELVILHFSGISAAGAGLIVGTAKWAKYHHEKNEDKAD